jgi:hypothetical protein
MCERAMALKVSQRLDGQLNDASVKTVLDEVAADDGFTQRILKRMRREGVTIDPDYDPLA